MTGTPTPRPTGPLGLDPDLLSILDGDFSYENRRF